MNSTFDRHIAIVSTGATSRHLMLGLQATGDLPVRGWGIMEDGMHPASARLRQSFLRIQLRVTSSSRHHDVLWNTLKFWPKVTDPRWFERRRHSMANCDRMVRDCTMVTMGAYKKPLSQHRSFHWYDRWPPTTFPSLKMGVQNAPIVMCRILNGHNSATGDPIRFTFRSMEGLSRPADRMALFSVRSNSRWRRPPSWKSTATSRGSLRHHGFLVLMGIVATVFRCCGVSFFVHACVHIFDWFSVAQKNESRLTHL